MHKVSLTTPGEVAAGRTQSRPTTDLEHYPEGVAGPEVPGIWTIEDDILVLLHGKTRVMASSPQYKYQQDAVMQALSDFGHARATTATAFRRLCQLGLIDCAYNVVEAIDEAASLFESLSHPARLLMVKTLLIQPCGATELSEITGKNVAGVYYHLRSLMQAGIVYSLGHGEGYVADGEFVASVFNSLVDYFSTGGDDGTTIH